MSTPVSSATQARRFIRPLPSDDWESIAARELSDQPRAAGNPILPSDIIFLEPPAAAAP